MPQEWRHESEDLEDFEVLDATDTLTGAPGDDPLDRGLAPPERWSAGMRFGTTAAARRARSYQSAARLPAGKRPITRLAARAVRRRHRIRVIRSTRAPRPVGVETGALGFALLRFASYGAM